MSSRMEWKYRGAGIIGGLMLAAGNIYGPAAFLYMFAFVPVLILTIRSRAGGKGLLVAGFYMGLAYTMPQVIALRLPIIITVILLVELSVIVMMMCWCGGFSVSSALKGSLTFACCLAVLDWAGFNAVPMWGTAQSVSRSMSGYPVMIWFVSLTGITGIVFVYGLLQSLAVHYYISRQKKTMVLFLMIFTVVVGGGIINACGRKGSSIKAAAVGWLSEPDNPSDQEDEQWLEEHFYGPIAGAAEKGAKVIGFPELAFEVSDNNRDRLMGMLSGAADRYDIWIITGCYDHNTNENTLLFIDNNGHLAERYSKTHLTLFEPFAAGNGDLKTVEIEGCKAGAMVCQDDNFTDLSRRYGRESVDFVVVPTLDWRPVRGAHIQNSVHRAVESGYSIIRPSVNGISAIISNTGQILADCDHFSEGTQSIVAEIPICGRLTVFSRYGNWLSAAGGIWLALLIMAKALESRPCNNIQ